MKKSTIKKKSAQANKGYEFLETVAIADIAFDAYGKTLEELFSNCGLALAESMVNLKTVHEKIEKTISLEHEELERLLFDFLEELVYLKDVDGFLPKRFELKIAKGNVYKLDAKAYGDKLDPKEHELTHDVKAITMHMFKIEKIKEGFTARVVIDI